MEEIRTAGAVAVVIIGILGLLMTDRGWMFFSKFRQAVRDALTRSTRRVSRPISRRYRQWRYKDKIAKLQPASYDEYEQLPDADKRLFHDFKAESWKRLANERFRELHENLEESRREYETVQSKQRDRILGGGSLIKTSDTDARLICGNCAFFSAGFESDNAGEMTISTLKGECHKDPATQNVYPFSVCSHHSALQGFAPSTNGFYVFAPPNRQETSRRSTTRKS